MAEVRSRYNVAGGHFARLKIVTSMLSPALASNIVGRPSLTLSSKAVVRVSPSSLYMPTSKIWKSAEIRSTIAGDLLGSILYAATKMDASSRNKFASCP